MNAENEAAKKRVLARLFQEKPKTKLPDLRDKRLEPQKGKAH